MLQENVSVDSSAVTGRTRRAQPTNVGSCGDTEVQSRQKVKSTLKRKRPAIKTRCDFMLTSEDGLKTFVEVKSVTLAETRAARAPATAS
jgi:DNA-binding sugar fermentation-stimulating protein